MLVYNFDHLVEFLNPKPHINNHLTREVELLCSEQTKANFARGSTEKQEKAQRQESKWLDMLNSLKSLSGPFTDAVEVEKYLAEPTVKK